MFLPPPSMERQRVGENLIQKAVQSWKLILGCLNCSLQCPISLMIIQENLGRLTLGNILLTPAKITARSSFFLFKGRNPFLAYLKHKVELTMPVSGPLSSGEEQTACAPSSHAGGVLRAAHVPPDTASIFLSPVHLVLLSISRSSLFLLALRHGAFLSVADASYAKQSTMLITLPIAL